MPEFDIFTRIEQLEEKATGMLTLREAIFLAAFGCELAFANIAMQNPGDARNIKDELIAKLKRWGINEEFVDLLDEDFASMCSSVEQQTK